MRMTSPARAFQAQLQTAVDPVLELLRRAINLVQRFDPAGVGARDLRECLRIQIAAQQQEFGHLYANRAAEPGEDPHRGFRAEAEARLEERRRAMEVAALIVDHHLPLLLKRDVKDLSRAAQVTLEEAHLGVEFIRTLDPHPGRIVQPRADAAPSSRTSFL